MNALDHAERTGRSADAREALRLVRTALVATQDIRAAQWILTSRLGTALILLCRATGDPSVLNSAIDTFERWREDFPDFEGLPEYAEALDVVLTNLTSLRYAIYQRDNDQPSWTALTQVLRDHVAATPADDPEAVDRKHKLATALLLGHENFRALDTAVEAVAVLREVVAATPPEASLRPIALLDLGLMLRRVAHRTRDVAMAREAVDVHRQALAAFPVHHPRRSLYVSSVASALGVLYDQTHDLDTLRERIDLLRQVMTMTERTTQYGLWLGGSLASLYDRTGDAEALDEGIELMRRGLTGVDSSAAERRDYTVRFATALVAKGDLSGLDLLDEATDHLRTAFTGMPDDDPNLVSTAVELHKVLHERAEWTGDPVAMAESVAVLRRAVVPASQNAYLHAAVLAMLGGELYLLYDFAGDKAALDEGITLMRASLTGIPKDDGLRGTCLANLSHALQLRGEDTNDLGDLDEAVTLARASGQDDTLAGALLRRFDRTGTLANLDEAIARYEQAVAGPHQVAANLTEYGRVRHRRHTATGAVEDLDAAVTAYRSAVDLVAEGHRNWPRVRQMLALALVDRFRRTGDTDALTEAVDLSGAVLAAVADDHPYRATYLAARALALRASHDASPSLSTLDEAITCGRAAVASTPPGHANEALLLANLASELQSRFEHSGDVADLLAARDVLDQALTHVPADRPRWAQLHHNLGSLLTALHRATGEQTVLDEAEAAHRSAFVSPAAPTDLRALAGVGLAEVHMRRGEPASAAETYAAVVGLLPGLAARSLLRGDAEESLRRFASVGRDAAACALAAGHPELAATLLEAGRGVLVAQALESRRDLTELREQAPELADRFERLNHELDASDEVLDRRRELDHKLATLVAQIRDLPGFAGFLRPPTVEDLLAQAVHGPIAQINVSRHRCDAIVLTTSGVRAIPLPALDDDQVIDRVVGFVRAIDATHRQETGFADKRRAQQTVEETLGWLWDTIAAPVLSTLELTEGRLWWSAVGPLAYLPLHAAGHHGEPARTVLDRAVSSYTPTVRALAHARRPLPTSVPSKRMLIVSMPTTPGGADLPGAARETKLLTNHFPTATLVTGETATRAAVLAALPDSEWTHFACHGHSDVNNPSGSMFLLQDHDVRPLTTLDLSRLRLDTAELAYLSACDTSRASPDLPDEAIHLTTSCQLAGFRHVVGTLWAIDDSVAADLAEQIYTKLGAMTKSLDTSHTARAVHHATRTLRDRYPKTPSLWAAHVHAGA